MAKRKTRRSNGAWKKDGPWYVHRDIRLSVALYLSFNSPGIEASGWRVQFNRDKMPYTPLQELARGKQMDLDEAKRYVERNYDMLISMLNAKIASHEEWKARKAKPLADPLKKTDDRPASPGQVATSKGVSSS